MRSITRLSLAVITLSAVIGSGQSEAAGRFAANSVNLPSLQKAAAKNSQLNSYGNLPLQFEQNVGQADKRVKFLSHSAGSTLYLTGTDAVICLSKSVPKPSLLAGSLKTVASQSIPATKTNINSVLHMSVVGANGGAPVSGIEELPGKVNYLIGSDPKNWHTGVATFKKVKYHDLYKNVDLVYYGTGRQLEYDFIVKPGGDPSKIKLAFSGATSMNVASSGDLVIGTAAGNIAWRKPVVYQMIGGKRRPVSGSYVALGGGHVSFAVSRYNASLPLVIDPILTYSTYVSGSGTDISGGIAVDSSGCAYITGSTNSVNFPTTLGVAQPTAGSTTVAYVSKLNAAGTGLVYSTYLGGNDYDDGQAIEVDASGNAYVTGLTQSANFPVTTGAYCTSIVGGTLLGVALQMNAFVSKLNPTGSALVYSTFLGPSSAINSSYLGNDLAIDSAGNAYIAGSTASSSYPSTTGAFQPTIVGLEDAFVTKLNAAGSALVYSTFLGSDGNDFAYGIAVDSSGNAYVAGEYDLSLITHFPTTTGAFQTSSSSLGSVGFVTKVNPTGTALAYSTYLGGSALYNYCFGVAVDSTGSAYVTGVTLSSDFPTTTGSFQPSYVGGVEQFVTKLNPAGSAPVYSTFLGDSTDTISGGIAIDSTGAAFVTGNTSSSSYPTTSGASQASYGGNGDGFITKVNPTGSALLYSSYFGGSGLDYGYEVAVSASGAAYVSGSTMSSNVQTTTGSYDPTSNGSEDAIVLKINATKRLNMLWSNVSGQFSTWWINAATLTYDTHGPYPGWKAIAVASGPDSVAHMILDNTSSHQFSLWTLNPDGTYSFQAYNPAIGSQAIGLTVTPDNHIHVLIVNSFTQIFSIMDITSTTTVAGPNYGPYNGWGAKKISSGPDGHIHLLLDRNYDHQVSLWDMTSSTAFTAPAYGPYPGWQATDMCVGADNHVHVLLNNTSGAFSLWDMTTATSFTHPSYGPFTGWTAQGIGVTDDSHVHVQLNKADGTMSLWDMASPTSYTSPSYGPFSGWSAVDVGSH